MVFSSDATGVPDSGTRLMFDCWFVRRRSLRRRESVMLWVCEWYPHARDGLSGPDLSVCHMGRCKFFGCQHSDVVFDVAAEAS